MFENIPSKYLGEFLTIKLDVADKLDEPTFNPIFERLNPITLEPIKRYKSQFPYSFEPHELWHNGNTITHEMKLEELWRSDGEMYEKAMSAAHKLPEGETCSPQYGFRLDSEEWAIFLNTYFSTSNLKAVQLIEYANIRDGYARYILRWLDPSLPNDLRKEVWVDDFGAISVSDNGTVTHHAFIF